jgi:Fe2+ or Zn2+ uptake regulation protein
MLQKCDIVQRMKHLVLDRFHAFLLQVQRSRTVARDEVFLVMYRLERCRPADIRAALADRGLDRITVYRTIRFMLEIGAAHELTNGMIELSDQFKHHHHHFSCSECGGETSFNDDRLEQALVAVSRAQGWELESHQIELAGRCSSCAR